VVHLARNCNKSSSSLKFETGLQHLRLPQLHTALQQLSKPLCPPASAPAACSTCAAPSARCASARQPAWRRCCWQQASLGSGGACLMHASWCTSPSAAHRQVVCGPVVQMAALLLGLSASIQHTGSVSVNTQESCWLLLASRCRREGCRPLTTQHACRRCHVRPLQCLLRASTQGQASDILIQAKEIERLRDLLISLYVKHCGQETESVCECASVSKAGTGCCFGAANPDSSGLRLQRDSACALSCPPSPPLSSPYLSPRRGLTRASS
jgi:hypothetical protein